VSHLLTVLLAGALLSEAGGRIRVSPVYTPRSCGILIATGSVAEYRLTSPQEGVAFDVDGDGIRERVAWTERGVSLAFLAIDRNHNGVIDDGTELIGGRTIDKVTNGFEALHRLAPRPEDEASSLAAARHNDGFLDKTDRIWSTLLLWRDENHNGLSETIELQPAGDLLTRIGLGYQRDTRTDEGGLFWLRGWVELKRPQPGERFRPVYDVVCRTSR